MESLIDCFLDRNWSIVLVGHSVGDGWTVMKGLGWTCRIYCWYIWHSRYFFADMGVGKEENVFFSLEDIEEFGVLIHWLESAQWSEWCQLRPASAYIAICLELHWVRGAAGWRRARHAVDNASHCSDSHWSTWSSPIIPAACLSPVLRPTVLQSAVQKIHGIYGSNPKSPTSSKEEPEQRHLKHGVLTVQQPTNQNLKLPINVGPNKEKIQQIQLKRHAEWKLKLKITIPSKIPSRERKLLQISHYGYHWRSHFDISSWFIQESNV